MKYFYNIKIGTKIILVVSTILVIALATIATTILMSVYTTSKLQAETIAKEVSINNASNLTNDLTKVRVTLQNVENSILYARKNNTMNREQIVELLQTTLLKSPNIYAVYTLWEPNMFDGKDSDNVNKLGHDSTGRFIPYVVRTEDGITLDPLMDYDKEGAGDYYLLPKKTGKVTLMEPLTYKVAGKDVLMISLVVPVYDENGTFLGIVGADLDITSLQKSIEEIKPLGGYSTLLTTKGNYVAHGNDSTKIMTSALDRGGLWKDILGKTSKGEELLIDDVSSTTGDKILRVFEPIHLEGTDTYWTFNSNIPISSIFAQFDHILRLVIILSLSTLLVILGIIILLTKRILSPLKDAIVIADKVAIGDLSGDIYVKSGDEIGKLMSSFSNMIENIRGQALNAQRIADGDLDFEIIEKSKEDVLAISMKQVVAALRALVIDANMLANAAVEGKLAIRADVIKHNGDYRKIIEGVNDTLDAIVKPLNIGMIQLDKMAKGQDLEVVNNEYKGEYFIFIDNLNQVRLSLYELIGESLKLVENAKEGNLSYRADLSSLKGGYLTIVQGINDSLDAVIKPVQEAAAVLDEMSKGNLQVSVKGEYMGDHAKIKNSLNETIITLSSYIGEISSVLTKMSNKNLVVEITEDYRGDFTEIKDSLNNIIKSFNEVLNDINDAVAQVASGSRQVSDSAQSLAQGTTEQASSVEELTSSMDEIAAKTKENAVNANQANTFALEAKTDAVKGNAQMNDMLIAMEEINETSTNISKIIKVIDEIAFQTNILALNAAVEAARAGQQGRGFAVVAEEVRNLAARSATAAKETSALIEGSVKKVKEGTKIADETAIALGKIVDGVSKVATLVGTIADASNEQATGIAQVNKGIMQVSQVIQTNSATSEESAAASEELSSQAELLNDKIARFNLKKELLYDGIKKDVKDIILLDNSNNKTINANRPKNISLDNKEFGKY